MSKLEHALENAMIALEHSKDFDTWLYEEKDKGNLSKWNDGFAVLTDTSIVSAYDIWELANYVKYTQF